MWLKIMLMIYAAVVGGRTPLLPVQSPLNTNGLLSLQMLTVWWRKMLGGPRLA